MLRYTFATLVLLSVLSGCSSLRPAVETDFQPYNKRERYQRFAFARPTDSLHNEINIPFRQLVEQVVTEQLSYRGYHFDPVQPDFMITFARFPKTVDLDIVDLQAMRGLMNRGLLDHTGISSNAITRTHRIAEGNVMLQVYDVMQKQVVWQGYTNRAKAANTTAEDPDEHTRFLIHSVVDRFPFHAVSLARRE
jgi:hypothetical protein